MNDFEIYLECGFTTLYKNLIGITGKIPCMVCKTHTLNVERCLTMPRNRFILKQKQLDFESNKFENLKLKLIIDKSLIEKNLDEILKQLDSRRDQVVQDLTSQINDYYNDLKTKITFEYSYKITNHEKLIDMDIKPQVFSPDFNFDQKMNLIEQKLQFFKDTNKTIDSSITNDRSKFIPGCTMGLKMNEIFGKFFESEPYKLSESLVGHTGAVSDLLIIDDNKLLTASSDKSIKLWDTNTNECLQTFNGHTNHVKTLCKLTDGLFASGSDDKTIRIWSLRLGRCVRSIDCVSRCLKLFKSAYLISASDQTVTKWNYLTGKCVGTFKGHTDEVKCVEVTMDDKIISGSLDKTLRIWTENGYCLKELRGHQDWIHTVKQLNEHLVASGCFNGEMRLWDANSWDCLKTFKQHDQVVSCFENILCNRFISGSYDGTIKFWDIDSLNCVDTIKVDDKFNYWILSLQVDTKGIIFVGSEDKTIKIWKPQI